MKGREKKLKLYLDTSVISALFDKKSPEMNYWTREFWKSLDGFEIFISDVVIAEVQETPDPVLKGKMIKAISGVKVLKIDEEAEWLSAEYIRHGAIPERYRKDAFHLGIATAQRMEVLLSWNYKHIVRRKTREIVRMVNARHSYPFLEIMSPPEILGGEE